MKVVINTCYGGFGLSHEGAMYMAKLKGLTLYCADERWPLMYFTVPPDQIPASISGTDFYRMSLEDRAEHNRRFNEVYFDTRNMARDDPFLVQTVEELGEESWGVCAELRVVEIPDGIDWEITEYDGNETVEEAHRSWR